MTARTTMDALPTSAVTWTPWNVVPGSGFEVGNDTGEVGLVQIDKAQFLVQATFRYSDQAVLKELTDTLQANGMDSEEAQRAVDEARTFTPSTENPTDLASIPPFARWFENTYGRHTLAAILHDNLITSTRNGGALRSDTLADRFFRQMLHSVGVPYLKRWVIWAAVALRTRWAAGELRRVYVCTWGALAVAGIAMFVHACLQWAGISGPLQLAGGSLGPLVLFVLAAVLPLAASVLWGEQYGASLVAAVAAVWILPAVLFALLGAAVYWVLERAAGALGLR